MIIDGSGSGKTNALLNSIIEEDDIDNIYLYAKDLSEPKYKCLIKKLKNAVMKHLNDPNAFIECVKYYEWSLWEYWSLQPKQKKINSNYIWWPHCRHYDK